MRSGEQAAEVASFADGVIVGSAFVAAAERGVRRRVRELAAELADGGAPGRPARRAARGMIGARTAEACGLRRRGGRRVTLCRHRIDGG